ncbi:hypothetical protein FRB90_010337 [Tulasnella sp. 427]|nr:hypothetical protein FRB90_010337 [Tulasnella sp. 427]
MAEQQVASGSYFTRRTPLTPISSADIYSQPSPYFQLPSWFKSNPGQPQTYLSDESNQKLREEYERQRLLMTGASNQPGAYPGGTILHKGFYDLLALSTPVVQTVSRFWTGAISPYREEPLVASPPYEQIRAATPPRIANVPVGQLPPPATSPTSTPAKKGRRVSKDMIGKPTGFVHLVHASTAEQAEELLTRWGPSGMGKLGDPRWARPIKDYVRQQAQARAIAEVVGAMHPTLSQLVSIPGESTVDDRTKRVGPAPLRVVNGMSTPSSLTATTINTPKATIESPVTGTPVRIEGLPSPRGGPWPIGAGPNALPSGLQHGPPIPEHSEAAVDGLPLSSSPTTLVPLSTSPTTLSPLERSRTVKAIPESEPPMVPSKDDPKPINPSLSTLEKAASARIYFENLYYPLFRQPPSRERRRIAMEREMDHMGMPEGMRDKVREQWRRNETDYLREQRKRVDVSAFTELKVIGHGAFGVVSLVKEKSTGSLFAMKQLRKTDMLRKGQEGHVRAEREVLKSAALVSSSNAAEWIVRMHYSFQDRDNLYLVLEYMGGGDLLNLLIEKDVFEENFARFYIAENFLFDPEGHIKLSDFGLATDLHWAHDTGYYEQQRKELLKKHGIDLDDPNGIADGRKTKRLAPKEIERIMGGQDGEGGIFTWREKNRKKRHVTRQKILNWKTSLKFPPRPRVSREGVNLMERLLCEPEDRIGSEASSSVVRPNSLIMQERRSGFIFPNVGKGKSVDGAEFIKAHPWFRGIDWTNIHRQAAPYKPNLSNPEDTRHFDDDIPAEPLAPANGAAPDATRDPLLKDKVHGDHIMSVRKALAFQGFTHRSPRKMDYTRIDTLYPEESSHDRGRDGVRRGGTIGRGRALSL